MLFLHNSHRIRNSHQVRTYVTAYWTSLATIFKFQISSLLISGDILNPFEQSPTINVMPQGKTTRTNLITGCSGSRNSPPESRLWRSSTLKVTDFDNILLASYNLKIFSISRCLSLLTCTSTFYKLVGIFMSHLSSIHLTGAKYITVTEIEKIKETFKSK